MGDLYCVVDLDDILLRFRLVSSGELTFSK